MFVRSFFVRSCLDTLLSARSLSTGTRETVSKRLSTIFALSSGRGKAAIAVIRVSGEQTRTTLEKLTGRLEWTPRRLALVWLQHPVSRERLDKSMAVWIPGPDSATGEDTCELHTHGGTAVVTAVLDAIADAHPHNRPAVAGEFTRRAFENGRLDLTEVEGLSDLLSAETQLQRRQALAESTGLLARRYQRWTDTLMRISSRLEGFIDFGEDENLPIDLRRDVERQCASLLSDMRVCVREGARRARLRTGVSVALVGRPNVGKSSLINILSQRDVSIVSAMAGTTRDRVEAAVDIGGHPALLVDTAGIRPTSVAASCSECASQAEHDPIETEGVRRTALAISECELLVLLIECPPRTQSTTVASTVDAFESTLRRQIEEMQIGEDGGDLMAAKRPLIVVFNKIDLLDWNALKSLISHMRRSLERAFPSLSISTVGCSCLTMEGIHDLLTTLTEHMTQICGSGLDATHDAAITRVRQRLLIAECISDLENFVSSFDSEPDLAVQAEALRRARTTLGRTTGRDVSTERLLDVIFADFCVGK